MKLYNQATDKIENVTTVTYNNINYYANHMSEADLNAAGYYNILYESQPNNRYYTATPSSVLVGNIYTTSYTAADKPLDQVKASLIKSISETFKRKTERPEVDTGLGYTVDGGREDVQNFETGKKYSLPQVKDINGVFHDVTSADYDTIITAIEQNGLTLYQTKWAKEAQVNAFTTVADCVLYEATPYDYTITQEDVDFDPTLTLGEIITKFRNNCTEWV